MAKMVEGGTFDLQLSSPKVTTPLGSVSCPGMFSIMGNRHHWVPSPERYKFMIVKKWTNQRYDVKINQ